MPKLQHFVVCESVSVDKTSNRTSHFNILEQVTVDQYPAGLAQVNAVALFLVEEDDYDKDFQLIVRIQRGSEESKEFPLNFKFKRPELRHRLTVSIVPLILTGPGDLTLLALLNGKQLAEHLITVTHKPSDIESSEDDKEQRPQIKK